MAADNDSQSAPGEELRDELAHGSMSAFAELVEQRGRELYRYFRLLGRDAHESDDGVQETFLRLYAYRGRLHGCRPGELGPLLYRIARNVWVDGLRRAQVRPRLRSFECLRDEGELGRDPSTAMDGALDARSALAKLPVKLRDVVLLCVFQGLSHREAAQALGIPFGTVKSRMLLAVKRLREVLDVPST